MTSPAVDTGIVAFIEARCDADERWLNDPGNIPEARKAFLNGGHDRPAALIAMRRAILALHRPQVGELGVLCYECDPMRDGALPYPCQTVRLLAAIDADREGYDPAWKPVAT